MNLQQLRYLHAAVEHDLNLSTVARALHTSQPGISRQLREFEAELALELFVRRGKRLVELTEAGRSIAAIAARIVADLGNLRAAAQELRDQDAGQLVIATTHTQARYSLPRAVAEFKQRHPRVHVSLHQGNPTQVADAVLAGTADIGVATEALAQYPKLLALPVYRWRHCVVAPPGHPLLALERPSIEDIAAHPVVTYDPAFAGRSRIDHAFAARGLAVDIVLSAIDSDVIKTYVELGLGIGIIAEMAFDPERDRGLRRVATGDLFGSNTSRLAVLRGRRLRGYVHAFIGLFAPQLGGDAIERALAGGRESYEL